METGELATKVVNNGVWGVLGVMLTAAFNYWRDKKKDDSQNTLGTLGAINEGSKALMEALLQSTKMLDQQLRETRAELRETDRKLDECETKHHDVSMEMAEVRRQLDACIAANDRLMIASMQASTEPDEPKAA